MVNNKCKALLYQQVKTHLVQLEFVRGRVYVDSMGGHFDSDEFIGIMDIINLIHFDCFFILARTITR